MHLVQVYPFFLMIFYHIRNKRKNKRITLYLTEKNDTNGISLKEKLLWLSLDSLIDFIASTLNIIFGQIELII